LLVALTARARLAQAVPAQTAPAQTAETPEQVTERFVAAMRAADWNGMASLMHQNALKEMRRLLAGVFESPNGGPIRQQLLGVTTAQQAQALSDTAVFAALMRTTTQDADVAELLKSAKVQVLGHVNEGSDTVRGLPHGDDDQRDSDHEDGCDVAGALAGGLAWLAEGRCDRTRRGHSRGDAKPMILVG